MANKDIFILTLATVLLLAVTACSYMNKKLGLKDDNVIEETGEAILKYKTGVDMDFTPDSIEKKSPESSPLPKDVSKDELVEPLSPKG